MGVSGSRAAALDINLDEFEKRLRAAGAQSAGIEDPLSELARLVESSTPLPRPPAAAPATMLRSTLTSTRVTAPASAPPPPAPRAETSRPIEPGVLRPALQEAELEFVQVEDAEPFPAEAEAEAYDEAPPVSDAEETAAPPKPMRGWALRVGALAIGGVAMIAAAAFVLRHKAPGLMDFSGAPPLITAAQGPTKVQPPSEDTVSAPSDGSSLLRDAGNKTPVKIVTKEEQPVDLAAQTAAMAPASPPAPPAPMPTVQTAPPPGEAAASAPASSGPDVVMKAPGDTPLVVPSAGAPPAMPSQFPDPKPVRTITLRPDGTPVSTTTEAAADAQPAPSQPRQPQRAPAPEPATPAAQPPAESAAPQASTPKVELPTKLHSKSSARVVVGKTDTTEPVAGDAGAPLQLGGPAKQEKAARPKAAERTAALDNPPAAGDAAPAAAATSGGWAVQLAAPRSEAEAKSIVEKLNARYASALNGATIGVHKAVVKGETIYRLRVTGLSKADAAAMCARLKGDGGQCFIAR